jgi:hypothetical protein
MKVKGVSVVRVQGGKVNVDATIAAYVVMAQEKAQKDYVDFCETLRQKLEGAKDHNDIVADALNAFFEAHRKPRARFTTQRSLVVDQIAGNLLNKPPFEGLSYNRMKETVEEFIRENAGTVEAPDTSAWFTITTGKGRNGGLITEQNPPILGMVAATTEELVQEDTGSIEEIDAALAAQIAAAKDALDS